MSQMIYWLTIAAVGTAFLVVVVICAREALLGKTTADPSPGEDRLEDWSIK